MAESIILVIFFGILLTLSFKDQRKIELKGTFNRRKLVISILLSGSIIIIFWENELASQLKVLCFAGLIILAGLVREGIYEDKLVRYGLFTTSLSKFDKVTLERITNEKSIVNFHNNNTHFSVSFDESNIKMKKYLKPLIKNFNQIN